MMRIDNFIKQFSSVFVNQAGLLPWDILKNLSGILCELILKLNNDFDIQSDIAIHKTAIVEKGVVLKAPVIIEQNCFVGANAYLRGGVYLGKYSTVGPNCEIKTSMVFNNTSIAHFNFIGDSIVGSYVNFEAGSLTANHHNERVNKNIFVLCNSTLVDTNTEKFGSLVGDNSKIGANAVLSPGTLLPVNTIVKRLELIDQLKG